MKPRILLDANVIYGQTPRDTFMHLAAGDAIEARWTNLIHEEWIGNLLKNRDDLTCPTLENVRSLMDRHARNCLVEGFESLIETLILPDADDRHVLAAAIHSQSSRIITLNLKDFPAKTLAPYGIVAQHPDAFLCELLREEAQIVVPLIATQRQQLRRPSRSVEEHLATLKRQDCHNSLSRSNRSEISYDTRADLRPKTRRSRRTHPPIRADAVARRAHRATSPRHRAESDAR